MAENIRWKQIEIPFLVDVGDKSASCNLRIDLPQDTQVISHREATAIISDGTSHVITCKHSNSPHIELWIVPIPGGGLLMVLSSEIVEREYHYRIKDRDVEGVLRSIFDSDWNLSMMDESIEDAVVDAIQRGTK
jgi:hypothetical protein